MGGSWIEGFLEPVFEHAEHPHAVVDSHSAEWGLMGASVLIGAAGIALAWHFYKSHPEIPARLAATFAGAHRVLLNKYYVDELYGALFVRGVALGGGTTLHAMDRYLVDGGDGEVRAGGGVNGIAWITRDVACRISNFFDWFVVDGCVNLTAFILDNFSYVFRALQNGLVQHYAWAMLVGVLLMIGAASFIPY